MDHRLQMHEQLGEFKTNAFTLLQVRHDRCTVRVEDLDTFDDAELNREEITKKEMSWLEYVMD